MRYIRRSTLADANERRGWRIHAALAQRLITQERTLYVDEELGLDLTDTVYALDSTTIALCLSVFPWAHFRTTKDNYATHKTAAVKAWLARRAHWHVHFTPTSASWINQVERWFAELTRKQLQRGVHTSTRQLEADIRAFIEKHNEDPKPFRWTKSADDILAAVKRFCLRVDQNLCHEL